MTKVVVFGENGNPSLQAFATIGSNGPTIEENGVRDVNILG
jgi:hypothetical protein